MLGLGRGQRRDTTPSQFASPSRERHREAGNSRRSREWATWPREGRRDGEARQQLESLYFCSCAAGRGSRDPARTTNGSAHVASSLPRLLLATSTFILPCHLVLFNLFLKEGLYDSRLTPVVLDLPFAFSQFTRPDLRSCRRPRQDLAYD